MLLIVFCQAELYIHHHIFVLMRLMMSSPILVVSKPFELFLDNNEDKGICPFCVDEINSLLGSTTDGPRYSCMSSKTSLSCGRQ